MGSTERLAYELDEGKEENAVIGLCTANIAESEVHDTENCDIFEKHEFSVKILFLPLSDPELNPIEMVWNSVKWAVTVRLMSFHLNAIEEMNREHIDRVTTEQFRKFYVHAIK